MPQIIEVPNYGQVEFPDGMSDADITTAIKKNALGYKNTSTDLTWSEKNLAPVLDNLYQATGLGSKPVQDFASGAADSYRGIGNLIHKGLGSQLFPNTGSGSGYQLTGELVDPITTAVGGEAFKLGAKAIPYVKAGAGKLMQSAMKPAKSDVVSGKAGQAISTLLDEGINATRGGIDALKGNISDVNNQISSAIANSNAMVDKNAALTHLLNDTTKKFMLQADPLADLNAINKVKKGFIAHPLLPNNDIPVQLAQQIKQGTYGVLSKKFGQLGSAETEAQKALARGLKDQIANAIPEIAGLNVRDSNLYNALNVAEKSRMPLQSNNNLLGLAPLVSQPGAFTAMMLDKSALAKSLLARSVNSSAKLTPYLTSLLGASSSKVLADRGLLD